MRNTVLILILGSTLFTEWDISRFSMIRVDWILDNLLSGPWIKYCQENLDLNCWSRPFWQLFHTENIYSIFFNHTCLLCSLSFHGGESRDFRGLKNGGFLSKPLDSGKTFFDSSVNTDQIGMGFEADTLENYSNMSIFCDLQTKIRLKSYWRATKFFSCSSITF